MAVELRASFEQCRRRFPSVDLSLEDYIARVQQAQASAPGVEIHQEDLFLACACSRGDRAAWEYFSQEYLPRIRGWASQACRRMCDGEDLSQELVKNLLDRREKFAAYDGRGSLGSWLRVAVSRAAIDRFRRVRREVSLEGMQAESVSMADPVEAAAAEENLDARWGPVIRAHLSRELDQLSAHDRLLLGLYYVEDVPLKAMAAHFGVHESTVSRWLDRVRNALRQRVEREMRARFGLRAGEIEALWRYAAGPGAHLEAVLKKPSQAGIAGSGEK